VTPPTPPKKRREDLIQALKLGEEWRVGGGGNTPGREEGQWSSTSFGRTGGGGEGGERELQRWSNVKVSALNFGGREGRGAMTVGRAQGRKGRVGGMMEIVAVAEGGGREGWF